jgi:hypothetical protein
LFALTSQLIFLLSLSVHSIELISWRSRQDNTVILSDPLNKGEKDMSDRNAVKGSCLCGAVNLSTTSINPHVAACHCSTCRKWGGSSLLAVECGRDVSFSGEENIGVYPSSDWAERGFCNKCGSHLFYRLKENNHHYIPVGIFDNSKDFVFDLQVFIEEKPEYYSFANETKNMTGSELFAMFPPPSDE